MVLRWAVGAAVAVVAVVVAGALSLFPRGEGSGALSVLRTADFHALAFSPEDANVLFFGHHNGIMRTNDGGRTWQPLVDRRNFDAMNLAISPTNPRQVYLAGHDIFQVSTDGGSSWQPVQHNLPGTDIHGFAMSQDDSNRLYAFVVGFGLFRSQDGGRTWQSTGGQLPGDLTALAAAGGGTETLYAGSMSSGMLKSTDGGGIWAPAAVGLGLARVLTVGVDPVVHQTVYAGGEGGLYKSKDGGASWKKLPFPGTSVVALAVSPAKPNVVVAIWDQGREGLVFRSEDGGATWGGR